MNKPALNKLNDLFSTHGKLMNERQDREFFALWEYAISGKDVAERFALLKSELMEKSRDEGFKKNFPTRPQQPKLNGFQQAAVKAGLDPATPGLERMSFAEMQSLAEQQQRARIEPLRQQNSRFYRSGLGIDAAGNVIRRR